MSVSEEKERRVRAERKRRESSVGRRRKEEDRGEGRPITSQEKAKARTVSVKEGGKSRNERTTGERGGRRKAEAESERNRGAERDRKSSKEKEDGGAVGRRKLESVEWRTGREKKVDGIYVKELRERRGMKKEGERGSRREKGKESEGRVKGEGEAGGGRRREGEGRKMRSPRDRTRTRTLSPTEIKQLLPSKGGYEMGGGDASGERGGGEGRGEAGGGGGGRGREEALSGSEEEYEDDFEEYKSDFEEDSEESVSARVSEDVEVLGSHSPEMEPWKKSIRERELEAIRKSIEKENEELVERKSQRRPPEEGSEKEKETMEERGQLIDFSKASKRLRRTKKEAANRRRGEELLNMITLDAMSFSVLEIPPIPYEEFMRAFGKSNTKQAQVQTNEDDLNEEVQTDEVRVEDKWTQNPPEYLGSRRGVSFVLTKEERLGVGGEFPSEEEFTMHSNADALWSFLSWASQLVLIALEKKSGNFLSLENMPNHSKAMAFGDGFVSVNVSDIPFLKGRSVTHLCVLSESTSRLLSVHVNKEKSFQKCMICIWSFRELSKPLRILLASNRISSCCFGLNQGNLVFAGFSDGSLCLWDLREPSAYHNRINSSEWNLQSPTYTTAAHLRESGHCSPVVAVRLLTSTDATSGLNVFTPMQENVLKPKTFLGYLVGHPDLFFQLCSLDNDGTIIIWTVIQLDKPQRNAPSDDLGLAHWGRVKLVKRLSFSVFSSLRDEIPGLYITSNDILINAAEDDGFYVANSLGSVHHCSAYGSPMKPKFYVPSKQDAIIQTTCLELCPFNGNYFLVGCGDGTIRLHSRHQEQPLICLNPNLVGDQEEAQVVSLTWMRTRPCVFFALDSLSRINIWDLGVSDMYPDISLVLTEKKITCMRLLPVSDPRQVPFIVVGTESGSVEIHKLKREYGCRSATDVQNEMKMFLKYVSIL